ncbi:MAG: hypothetical protein RJB55_2912, partial [Verrucomicrobiota bacterium]
AQGRGGQAEPDTQEHVAGNVFLSVGLGLAAAALGYRLARGFAG